MRITNGRCGDPPHGSRGAVLGFVLATYPDTHFGHPPPRNDVVVLENPFFFRVAFFSVTFLVKQATKTLKRKIYSYTDSNGGEADGRHVAKRKKPGPQRSVTDSREVKMGHIYKKDRAM